MLRKLLYCLLFAFLLWLAHSLAYLLHEYGHSFTAWAVGWKSNPLAITYGRLTLRNVAFLADFDENVDYDPIFAAGKGYLASLIAIAGISVNAILYFVARALSSHARRRARHTLGLFAFLFCLMNAGNFLDYVPVRTFATHGDMANLQKGLQIGPWWVVILLGLPTAAALAHFFVRLLPGARAFLYPGHTAALARLVAISSFMMFVFYGASGLHGYGPISRWLSLASTCVAFPAVLALCWPRRRNLAALPALR
jgi:hypothetical protein